MVQIRQSLLIVLLFSGLCFAGDNFPPTVVFMSDFGVIDDSVAICKGVMLGIAPDLRIIDITHDVKPYSILDAARFLAGTTPYFPAGTVFVVVVDPGVGSSRKPVVIKSKRGQYFVLPDNGIITMVAQNDGVEEIREITNPQWLIGAALSSTFHGRDIFSPVAAHLAAKEDWAGVGPQLTDAKRLPIHVPVGSEEGIVGEIIGTDGPYGNLITNINGTELAGLPYKLGETVHLRIGEREFHLPYVKTFSDVPLNQPLLYVDSRGRLGLAVNQSSFVDLYKITPPVSIQIYKK